MNSNDERHRLAADFWKARDISMVLFRRTSGDGLMLHDAVVARWSRLVLCLDDQLSTLTESLWSTIDKRHAFGFGCNTPIWCELL
ncbi:MAG: hypothetical protein M1440_02585 [Gammaproteobacteria bacterium]|nr:hypothetical protein [Gammaproteobacteria bacterium]